MYTNKVWLMLLVMFANIVCAETAEVYEAIVDTPPQFDYSKATVTSPVVVQAKTKDGKCTFRLSMVGLQSGESAGDTLTGRCESAFCDGKALPIIPSVVTGAAIGSGTLVTLLPSVTVILLHHGSGKAEKQGGL